MSRYDEYDDLRIVKSLRVESAEDADGAPGADLLKDRILLTAKTEMATMEDEIEEFAGDDAPFTTAAQMSVSDCFTELCYDIISEGAGYDITYIAGAKGTDGKDRVFTCVVIDSGNPMGQIFNGDDTTPAFAVYDGLVDGGGEDAKILREALSALRICGVEGKTLAELREDARFRDELDACLMPPAAAATAAATPDDDDDA